MELNDILEILSDIKYGYISRDGKTYEKENDFDESFDLVYRLQSPKRLVEMKRGICWDYVELERVYLEKFNYEYTSYYIETCDEKNYHTHTFILVNGDYCYWIEKAWDKYAGIHKFKDKDEALRKIINHFKDEYNLHKKIDIYEYDKPLYGITSEEFILHCKKGNKVI